MSRYRPPSPKSSPYITAEGATQLREELRQLWKVERPQVTQIVHEQPRMVTVRKTATISMVSEGCVKLIDEYAT